MKGLLSWFKIEKIEKFFPEIIQKPALLKSVQTVQRQHYDISRYLQTGYIPVNKISLVSFFRYVFSRVNVNMTPFLKQPLFLAADAIYQQVSSQCLNYGNYLKVITQRTGDSLKSGIFEHYPSLQHDSSTEKENILKYYFLLGHKSSSILPQASLPQTSSTLRISTFYPHTAYSYNISLFRRAVNLQSLIEDNSIKTLSHKIIKGTYKSEKEGQYPSTQKENIREYRPVFELRSPVILSKANLLQNNSIQRISTFYQYAAHNIFSQSEIVNPRTTTFSTIDNNVYNVNVSVGGTINHKFQNYSNYLQIIPQTLIKKSIYTGIAKQYLSTHIENVQRYKRQVEQRSTAILLKYNIFLNSSALLHSGKDPSNGSFNITYQNSAVFIKPIIRQDNFKYGSSAASFIPVQRKDVLTDNDNFYFQNHRKVEQAIEQIKKIVEENRKGLVQRSMPSQPLQDADPRRQIDINQISDQVYRMIDLRLKIEKERRGYI
ncbi:MAG: hypothetical protein WA130_10065 [Candidatus Methanoperedens sp.]